MTGSLLLLVPLLVLPAVLLFAFAGCAPFGAEDPPPMGPVFLPPIVATYDGEVLGTDAVAAYWRLSEASASEPAKDEVAARNGAYSAAGVTYRQTGPLDLVSTTDRAVVLDGAAGLVEVAPTMLHNPAKFTVEAWIRPTAAQAGSTHQIVSAHDVAGGQESGYALAVVGGTPPKIRGRIWHGTGAPAEVSFTVSAGFGSRWWYVALTYDGSVMRLFVDGAPAPVPQGETATGLRQNTAFPLRIGAERAGAQSAPADFFAGGVDEVAIYSRALTAAEIKTRFDLSKKKT